MIITQGYGGSLVITQGYGVGASSPGGGGGGGRSGTVSKRKTWRVERQRPVGTIRQSIANRTEPIQELWNHIRELE